MQNVEEALNRLLDLQHRKYDHEQARTFYLASELSQRTALTGNSARDRARKGSPIFAKISKAMKITLTRFHVVAIAAGLLLAMSGLSFAAPHPASTHSQGSVKKNRGVVTSPSRVPVVDPRGTSGVSFPYPDRPYGDPDHW
jgi:hypothetical protein